MADLSKQTTKPSRAVVFTIVFIITIFTGCRANPPRLQQSEVNTCFKFTKDVPFEEYIRITRSMIEKTRVDINERNKAIILEANSPFELKPDLPLHPQNENGKFKKGILLIHGLLDSPYIIKHVALYLQSKGFLVRSILLPGHGTVPADLTKVTYHEWIKAAEYGIQRLQHHAEKVYTGGFSTGGALSIHLALRNPGIKGLILFSPALGIKTKMAWLAGVANFFTDWLAIRDDMDYARYESFPSNAADQIYQLTCDIDELILKEGKNINTPVFIALSADDITVDAEKTLYFFKNFVSAENSMLILYTTKIKEHPVNKHSRIVIENSFLPEERILNFSHISILIPPDDPHYGKNGDYKWCLHYQRNKEKRIACMNDSEIWQGEITKEDLANHTLRRLTYNPLYNQMIKRLDCFLEMLE
jgi:esterase/lipase